MANTPKPSKIAIASCTPHATDAAAEVAKHGGNAIDAAVAGAFDLMVSNILMCSIGGGGFATVKIPGQEPVVFDFFDAMPGIGVDKSEFGKNIRKIHVPYGIGTDILTGYASIGVPGTAKGLELISKRFGNLPMKEILSPATRHAREGVPLNGTIAYWLSISAEKIHWFTEYSKSLLSTDDGQVPAEGYPMKNPDLADTFEIIAEKGTDTIYGGELGREISDQIRKGGGLLTVDDLKNYRVIERKALKTAYGKYNIYTNPPPAVGGITLVQMLKAMSYIGFKGYDPDTVSKIGKIIYTALNDRYSVFKKGSRDFDDLYKLVEDDYIVEKYENIRPSPNTTQISCTDDLGNSCSITMSMGYGSGVAAPGLGICFGNTLGELELNPFGLHALDPGMRLVSGMAPTIGVDEKNGDILVIGTPGASRIPSALMQTITNISELGLSIDEALKMPRVHWEDNKLVMESQLEIDENQIPAGWEIVKFDSIEMYFGGVQCVRLNKGELTAASDPRRCGKSRVVEC